MAKIINKLPASYWEIEKKQRIISVWLFFLLFLFYILTIGFISAAILISVGIFISGFSSFTATFFISMQPFYF
jgi:hypothetical protein